MALLRVEPCNAGPYTTGAQWEFKNSATQKRVRPEPQFNISFMP
jgi:hypothetical protein